MSLYEDFATDQSLESSGVVRNFGDFWIKIARAGGSNKAYQRALKRRTDKVRRAMELNKLPVEESNRIMVEVYADTIVLDWGGDGMVNRDGTPLPFNRDNVVKVLTDLPDLFLQIAKDANEADTFKAETLKADAGD